MKHVRTLAVAAFAFMAMLLIVGVANAQDPDNSVVNYVFEETATRNETGTTLVIGQTVNVRAVPAADVSRPIGSLAEGSYIEILGSSGTGWSLGRGFSERGIQVSFGWINDEAADFQTVPDTTGLPVNLIARNCPVSDGAVQNFVQVRWNDRWVEDVEDNDCNKICEGRMDAEENHNLWVLRDVKSGTMEKGDLTWAENEALLDDGLFFELNEGTCWDIPRHWNVGDTAHRTFDCAKEYGPIACAFAGDKMAVMTENGYEWPIFIHRIDEETLVYEHGSLEPANVDRCDYDEPVEMNITGAFHTGDGIFVSTSVGAIGCRTLILWQLPDRSYQMLSFEGARESLSYYRSYKAYLIPSSWDQNQFYDQVMVMLGNAFSDGFLTDEGVAMFGIPGMEDGSVVNPTGAAPTEPQTDTNEEESTPEGESL